MSPSIVLAAHGCSNKRHVNAHVRQLAQDLQASASGRVVAAFHQGEPHFSKVLEQLPAGRVVVVPYMTSAGYYCANVLPRELRKNRNFDLNIVQIRPPVGAHPMMESILGNRIRALVQTHDLQPSNLAVILVGHGTPRHAASRITTIELAGALQSTFQGPTIVPAFIDDEPSVQSAFASLGHLDCIVLPFFMSSGMHAVGDLSTMFGKFGMARENAGEPLAGRDGDRRVVLDRPVGQDAGMIAIVKDLARWQPGPATPRAHVGKTIRLGTRGSKMALWQAKHVAELLRRDGDVEIVELSTLGDRDRTRPIDALGSDGPFTDDIEIALIENRIDVAVHSLKDLPLRESPETRVAAILPRGDARECIVAHNRLPLANLPHRATVGTSCVRRAIQALRLRPDLRMVPLRGPVDDRVKQVLDGKMDAAILAWVGLQRLGLEDAASEIFDVGHFLPAPGQAALAVQVRADDRRMVERVALLDDPETRTATDLELNVQRAIEGPGHLTVAAFARRCAEQFHLHARIMRADTNGTQDIIVSGGTIDDVLTKVLGRLELSRCVGREELVH